MGPGLSQFLGISPKDIGQFGGGKRKSNGNLDVAMIQSLIQKGVVSDIVGNYGYLIVDECHHIQQSVLSKWFARARPNILPAYLRP